MSSSGPKATSPPERIFLFSHARTACQLLEHMLSQQPKTVYSSHYLVDASHLDSHKSNFWKKDL